MGHYNSIFYLYNHGNFHFTPTDLRTLGTKSSPLVAPSGQQHQQKIQLSIQSVELNKYCWSNG